jgi:hypothetical protein
MKNAIFWDGGLDGLSLVRTDVSVEHVASKKLQRVNVNVFPTSQMEEIISSITSVLARTTRRHIPEDGSLQSASTSAETYH